MNLICLKHTNIQSISVHSIRSDRRLLPICATHLPCTNVLILKPNVGLTDITSSPFSFLRMVVFPALSSPLEVCCDETSDQTVQKAYYYRKRTLISFSFILFLRIMVRRPMLMLMVQSQEYVGDR